LGDLTRHSCSLLESCRRGRKRGRILVGVPRLRLVSDDPLRARLDQALVERMAREAETQKRNAETHKRNAQEAIRKESELAYRRQHQGVIATLLRQDSLEAAVFLRESGITPTMPLDLEPENSPTAARRRRRHRRAEDGRRMVFMVDLDLTPPPNTVWPVVADFVSWSTDGPYHVAVSHTMITGIALDINGRLYTYVLPNSPPEGARPAHSKYASLGPTTDEQLVPLDQVELDRELSKQRLVLEWRDRLTGLVSMTGTADSIPTLSALYKGLSIPR
jgi:hypothetical protein